MTKHRLKQRVAALRSSVEGLCESPLGNLHIIGKQCFEAVDDDGRPITFPEIGNGAGDGADMLLRWVKETGAELVILDNLSQLAAMQDENDAAGARELTAFTSRLRSAGCAVLLIHHDNKSGQGSEYGFRGSSGLNDPLDVRIGLSKAKHPAGAGVAFKLNFWKMRHLMPEANNHCAAWLADDGKQGNAWRTSGDTMPEDVSYLLDMAQADFYPTQAALADELGWSARKVSDTLKKAYEDRWTNKTDFVALMKSQPVEAVADM